MFHKHIVKLLYKLERKILLQFCDWFIKTLFIYHKEDNIEYGMVFIQIFASVIFSLSSLCNVQIIYSATIMCSGNIYQL